MLKVSTTRTCISIRLLRAQPEGDLKVAGNVFEYLIPDKY